MGRNYDEWYEVCEAFCKKVGAELVFVNSDSFGIRTKDDELRHIYAEELMGIILGMKERGEW